MAKKANGETQFSLRAELNKLQALCNAEAHAAIDHATTTLLTIGEQKHELRSRLLQLDEARESILKQQEELIAKFQEAQALHARLDAQRQQVAEMWQAQSNAERQLADSLAGALSELVAVNERWNSSVAEVTGTPPGWSDSYLENARKLLKEYEAQRAKNSSPADGGE